MARGKVGGFWKILSSSSEFLLNIPILVSQVMITRVPPFIVIVGSSLRLGELHKELHNANVSPSAGKYFMQEETSLKT